MTTPVAFNTALAAGVAEVHRAKVFDQLIDPAIEVRLTDSQKVRRGSEPMALHASEKLPRHGKARGRADD